MDLPLIVYAGPLPLWIMFFFMGMYFSRHSREYSISLPLVVCVVGICLQVLEYVFWLEYGQQVFGIKLSSFIFSAGVIVLVFARKIEDAYDKENRIMKIITCIGGISFGIYLAHCYFIMALRILMPEAGWMFSWALVLSATIAFIWFMKRLSPIVSVKYLGFQ